ncbi:hypothetical protein [Pseudoalteromonas obscura]|uniref:Orphan protein n=1 Tax=Pseudoalteromonas obscura TaxID=3048491 RepID=A0ABT7ERQ5_9GAMM|nr:hypothetical protein [Pseudoalteromonas sp. P94(2023)]MDK2597726.1 hypothetical protein [Pseudoalteromonas sp. P94(2023)]
MAPRLGMSAPTTSFVPAPFFAVTTQASKLLHPRFKYKAKEQSDIDSVSLCTHHAQPKLGTITQSLLS